MWNVLSLSSSSSFCRVANNENQTKLPDFGRFCVYMWKFSKFLWNWWCCHSWMKKNFQFMWIDSSNITTSVFQLFQCVCVVDTIFLVSKKNNYCCCCFFFLRCKFIKCFSVSICVIFVLLIDFCHHHHHLQSKNNININSHR